jgi:hypothetical protein
MTSYKNINTVLGWIVFLIATAVYFITLEENKVHDSSGNLYMEDFEDYLVKNSDVQDNAGHVWEIYYEILDENL